MRFVNLIICFIFLCTVCSVSQCHRHDHYSDSRKKHGSVESSTGKSRVGLSAEEDEEDKFPFSQKRFEKMLKKAILKIITGELTAADKLLLKSFNYSHSDIETIREWELSRKKDEEESNLRTYERIRQQQQKKKKKRKMMNEQDEDLQAFNRQAIEDYENLESVQEPQLDDKESTLHERFGAVMKPHVVFEIRYDDSEFDSNSDETLARFSEESQFKDLKFEEAQSPSPTFSFSTSTPTPSKSNSFQDSTFVVPLPYLKTSLKNEKFKTADATETSAQNLDFERIPDSSILESIEISLNDTNNAEEIRNLSSSVRTIKEDNDESKKRVYKGLEWIDDDVYRVIPEAMESFNYENEENGTFDYDEEQIFYDTLNDTIENQSSSWVMPMDDPEGNLTSYQKFVLAQRRDQGQKAIEDIKLRVLVMTGRFNLTNNQVQKERLTMFSPICQMPRNTDPDIWADPFSMNMHFQLNLTASDHIAAARLRIFNLPQENQTTFTSTAFEGDEEDEKKVRISVYFYTKALKRHRAVKKRLMDSVVTSLTSTGNHLALDVRQALRFWQRSSRYSHGNGSNHGLVVQVEDQDGRPLKPALYIQQPSCQTTDLNTDEKAYQFVPALFVRACSRYVRFVNGEIQTYFYCKKS